MSVGLLTIHLSIPGCASLKEKRSRLKPLLARLQREFNISVAEVDHQDVWQSTTIAIAMVTSNRRQTARSLQKIPEWIEHYWPDLTLIDDQLEIF